MIKGKNGITAVVLALASAPSVFTFIQHENGGLSQGDDSSATAMLQSLKDQIVATLEHSKRTLTPMSQVEALMKRFPGLESEIPAPVLNKLKSSRSIVVQLQTMQQEMIADIADIDKLLEFAQLYDSGVSAKVPEGDTLDKSIESIIDMIFPSQSQTSYEGSDGPRPGDTVIGCGKPGCEGCGGRRMFTFQGDDTFGGIPHIVLGNIEVPGKTSPFSGVDLPEELKGLLGDNVHVVRVGGQRGTDPMQGLARMLEAALGNKK